MNEILKPSNMNEAYRRVVQNKVSCGVEDIEVDDLLDYLKDHKVKIIGKIKCRKYKPKPVKRVQIPKANERCEISELQPQQTE